MAQRGPWSWVLPVVFMAGCASAPSSSTTASSTPSGPRIANIDYVPPEALSAAQAIDKAKTESTPSTMMVLAKLVMPDQPCGKPPCPQGTHLFNDDLRVILPPATEKLVEGQRYVLEGKMYLHKVPNTEWVLVAEKLSVLH